MDDTTWQNESNQRSTSMLTDGNTLQNWELVCGFLLPLLMSLILQSDWRREVQAVLTFLVCFIVAAVGLWLQNALDFTNWFGSVLIVFVTAIPSYYGFWKPTGVAPAVERATNLR